MFRTNIREIVKENCCPFICKRHLTTYWVPKLALVILFASFYASGNAQAQGTAIFSTLYTFKGATDGGSPSRDLVRDSGGNLYGGAAQGGNLNCAGDSSGCGVIFKIDSSGTETVLYAFSQYIGSVSGLLLGGDGNLYGSTGNGGAFGGGTVFRLDLAGNYTTIHNFNLGGARAAGAGPLGLLGDGKGNLYGMTSQGGNQGSLCPVTGCGVLFRLDPSGRETVLHSFNGTDGFGLAGSLIGDNTGNLYGGTTGGGNVPDCNCGTVFKFNINGETVLHNFSPIGGSYPMGGLARDRSGNLYGTTTAGGPLSSGGNVYTLDPTGNETVLYKFTGLSDGSTPVATLLRDQEGNLYGTTEYGGAGNSPNCFGDGCGVVFKIDTAGRETILHTFTGPDGANPFGGLTGVKTGDLTFELYGTTRGGGDPTCRCGTVFKITLSGAADFDQE